MNDTDLEMPEYLPKVSSLGKCNVSGISDNIPSCVNRKCQILLYAASLFFWILFSHSSPYFPHIYS